MRGLGEGREGDYVLTCMYLPTAHLEGHGRFWVCFEEVQVAALSLCANTAAFYANIPSVETFMFQAANFPVRKSFAFNSCDGITSMSLK